MALVNLPFRSRTVSVRGVALLQSSLSIHARCRRAAILFPSNPHLCSHFFLLTRQHVTNLQSPSDKLDKAIDLFQERVLKSGAQDNESVVEQHKDEMISDAIRDQYKNITGKDFFVADK